MRHFSRLLLFGVGIRILLLKLHRQRFHRFNIILQCRACGTHTDCLQTTAHNLPQQQRSRSIKNADSCCSGVGCEKTESDNGVTRQRRDGMEGEGGQPTDKLPEGYRVFVTGSGAAAATNSNHGFATKTGGKQHVERRQNVLQHALI
jgi:hypothetical protein